MARKVKRAARASAFTHAVESYGTAVANKTIKSVQIVARIFAALNLTPPVKAGTKLAKLPGGGTRTPWDFALMLMLYPAFLKDGLGLNKKDVMNISTFEELGDLVFQWYADENWTIEP
jgi:hypothetical protein